MAADLLLERSTWNKYSLLEVLYIEYQLTATK